MAGAFTHNGNIVEGLPSIASQINYSNTSSGMQATQVQAAIDELNTNKQPKTDNNLTTTSKETTGAINEINSNLTSKVGIATATDLNGEKSIGVKTFAHTATGIPSNHSGTALCLFQNENYGMQIAQSSSESEAYVRFYNTDTWSSWDKIATDSDLNDKSIFTAKAVNAPSVAVTMPSFCSGFFAVNVNGVGDFCGYLILNNSVATPHYLYEAASGGLTISNRVEGKVTFSPTNTSNTIRTLVL